jgi:hypothetical protein
LLGILFCSINYFNKKEQEEKYKGKKTSRNKHQPVNNSETDFDLAEIELAIRESSGIDQPQGMN